jgi:hypothetical protein
MEHELKFVLIFLFCFINLSNRFLSLFLAVLNMLQMIIIVTVYEYYLKLCTINILIFYCNSYGLFSEGSIQDRFLLHTNINQLQLSLTDNSLAQ